MATLGGLFLAHDFRNEAGDLHRVHAAIGRNLDDTAAATPSDRSTICARSSRVNADDQRPRRLDLFAPRPQQVHEFDLAQGRLGVGPSSLDVRRSRLAQNERTRTRRAVTREAEEDWAR
jgi:hypothetical protein